MNKKLTALVAAAIMSLSAGSVLAADHEVTLDSSLSIEYRHDTANGSAAQNGTKTLFTTDATIGLAKNVDFYGRIAAQNVTNVGHKDFVSSDDTKNSVVALDQYGIIIKGGDNNFVYKIGRQSIGLGANETIYSSAGYYGDNTQADGITITGKSGVFDLKAVAAKEDTFQTAKSKIYGFQASYQPSDAWTLGTTLAKYNQESTNTSYYAVNAGYTFSPKASLMAEYVKANADSDNKAYNAVFNYAFDDKLTGTLTYSRTEANSTPVSNSEAWTAFEAGSKGFFYGLDYKLGKDYTLSVLYKDMKTIDTNDNWKSFRTTLSYKF